MGIKRTLGIFLVASVAMAAPSYESLFKGTDARSTKACELRVKKTYYKGNTGKWADLRAEVETGYGHGSETPGEFVLAPDAKDPKYLVGTSGKSSLTVALKTAEKLESSTAYALKWDHDGHFHNYKCNALTLEKP